MAKQLTSDELWAVIEPLLPPEPEKRRGDRPRTPNRDVLRGHLVRTRNRVAVGVPTLRNGVRLRHDVLA